MIQEVLTFPWRILTAIRRRLVHRWFTVVVLLAFVLPTGLAIWFVPSYAAIYRQYVDELHSLTGLNKYVAHAIAALAFIPFYLAFKLTTDAERWRRRLGGALLLVMFAAYNLGLYRMTQQAHFRFSTGAAIKWFAITPKGVRYYDDEGVDPEYGIALQAVTQKNIRSLQLLEEGKFQPIDPSTATFFNQLTGEAQVWYYQNEDDVFEFYGEPGFHPRTGKPLEPVTHTVLADWRKSTHQQAAVAATAAAPAPPPAPPTARRDTLEDRW